jgi:hypothetical protein
MTQPTASPLIGRIPEARAVVTAMEKGRSVVITGNSGIGKTAMLETLREVFDDQALTVEIDRLAPFGNFLREVWTALWDARALGDQIDAKTMYQDVEDDRKFWNKLRPNNDAKAKALVEAFEDYATTATRANLVIHDVSGITPSIVPWLCEFEKHSTLIVATTADAFGRKGTKRFWKLLEEIQLNPLSQKETGELVDKLTTDYNIVVSEPGMYRTRVIALSGGVPGEVVRIVRYLSAEDIVRSKQILALGNTFAERQERGIAIAPIMFALTAFFVAWRYIARAQGNLDGYVLSGIAVGVAIVIRLLMGKSLKARSA